jgi:TonB family protein
MLPQIIQQQYTQAKASFDRKEFGVAADGFSRVLLVLADPDVASEAKLPPLSDLRTLAIGFAELSAKAAAPPPPPVVAPPPPAPVVETAHAVANRIYTATLRIYSTGDANVVPPATLNQTLPMFPGPVKMPRVGKLEVVIDETGTVESAIMIGSVNSDYDSRAVAATKTWRYKPATLNGTPVKFRKIVQIAIKGST